MFFVDGLTPVERAVQQQQVTKARCAVCLHRGREVFEGEFLCAKNLRWPKGGPRCGKFSLDESA
jgi:hypothetical protein